MQIVERSKLVKVNLVMVDLNIQDFISILQQSVNVLACAENANDPSWTIVIKEKQRDD